MVTDDDLSAHRTRTNRRPDSGWPVGMQPAKVQRVPAVRLMPHPSTVAEINDAMSDVIEDRS